MLLRFRPMLRPGEAAHPLGNCVDATGVSLAEPDRTDGPHLWRLARDSQVLALNSSYAYLLWCRDFAGTSVVARVDGNVVGFVTGFLRPEAPDTVMVWQVAVDARQRRRNLASRMLHTLVGRLSPQGVCWLQATVSRSNEASIRLFSALARDRGTGIERRALFAPEDFPADEPDGHEAEYLYVIGPFRRRDDDSTRRPTSQTEHTGEHFWHSRIPGPQLLPGLASRVRSGGGFLDV